jgi:hypothetical protein
MKILASLRHVYLVFFVLDPEVIKSLSLGSIWNFSKEQGSTELITGYGSQRARYIRPRCIGTIRA